jgi:hypothetical protein
MHNLLQRYQQKQPPFPRIVYKKVKAKKALKIKNLTVLFPGLKPTGYMKLPG